MDNFRKLIKWPIKGEKKIASEEEVLGRKLESLCTEERRLARSVPSNFHVFRVKLDGRDVAVKRVIYDHRSSELSDKFDFMKREWDLQIGFDHDNVMKLIAVGSTENYKYLVLELCAASLDRHFLPDGNVDKYMGPLPESQLQMLYEIASGLAYIHAPIHGRDQTGLQHRDIKPQNILFSLGTDPVRMKVADFGCVKAATQTGSASWSFNHGGGPEEWRSPEMINWEREDQKARAEGKPGPPRARLTNKTDVFSAGLVFFAILTNGLHPFGSGQMLTSNIHEGRRVNFNELPDSRVKEIIGEMLAQHSNQRPTMEQIQNQLRDLIDAPQH